MTSIDRRQAVRVERQGAFKRQRQIVADYGAERRSLLRRIIQGVWLLVGVLEGLLAIRLLLKLVAANPAVPFAALVYGFTDLFLVAFKGLTVTPTANGMVLEIFTLIAMLVYALVGWVVTELVWLVLRPSRRRTVTTYEEHS